MNETSDKGLDWLLESLIERAVGAQHAVVLSEDGLLMGKSSALTQDNADQLAAVACAFQSLARGTGRQFDGGDVRQTIVEMAHRFLFVTAAGHGACLAVLAAENADMGQIAYEMNLLVKRVGQYLSAAPRSMPAGG
ncbi:MAG TPA: roadblock/LC7 domain-containing protein [Pseudonocardiaceae bacterium]